LYESLLVLPGERATEHGHFVAPTEQLVRDEWAEKARAAEYQDLH